MTPSGGKFRIYQDPDEEAFQRSLLGAEGSAPVRSRRERPEVRSPLDRRTAQSKTSDFLNDSVASLAADCSRSEFVPFRAEIPAYEDMDGPQTSYYLFWRRKALEGRFLASDEGYVLLLCYELINRTLPLDAGDAAALLFRLAEEYCGRMLQLRRLLPRWIEDYYSLFISVDRLYSGLRDRDESVVALFDCGRFLPSLLDGEDMTYEDVAAISGFSEKRSLFANNWDQISDFRLLLPQVFAAIRAVPATGGGNWLWNIPIYKRRAFPGAIYAGDSELETNVIDLGPGPQRDHFARVARLTELLMAQRMGYDNKRMAANVARLISQIDDRRITDLAARTVEDYFA